MFTPKDPIDNKSAYCSSQGVDVSLSHTAIFHYIDGLVQDCSNSIANTLELLQSCTKPSI